MTRGAAGLLVGCLFASARARAGGFQALAKELSSAAADARIERVAVMPFAPTDASAAEDGWQISESLVTDLVRGGRVRIVERALLEKILGERRLARAGLLDAPRLRTLGRIVSVDGVITGTFAARGNGTGVHARLIDARTGVVVAAADGDLERAAAPAPRAGGAGQPAIELQRPGGDASCAEVNARVDRLESLILDLKARYWARRLKAGGALTDGLVFPGSTISDPDLKQALYDRMNHWYGFDAAALTAPELSRLAEIDQRALALYRRCSPNDPRAL